MADEIEARARNGSRYLRVEAAIAAARVAYGPVFDAARDVPAGRVDNAETSLRLILRDLFDGAYEEGVAAAGDRPEV